MNEGGVSPTWRDIFPINVKKGIPQPWLFDHLTLLHLYYSYDSQKGDFPKNLNAYLIINEMLLSLPGVMLCLQIYNKRIPQPDCKIPFYCSILQQSITLAIHRKGISLRTKVK